MATQETALTDVAKRIQAGEELGAAFGVSETQLQALAAVGYNQYQQGRLDDAETMFRGVAWEKFCCVRAISNKQSHTWKRRSNSIPGTRKQALTVPVQW